MGVLFLGDAWGVEYDVIPLGGHVNFVETFLDWNDDGVGDFAGLAHRMDYLHELGITCLWLMPFYPTPNKDDGYDIADFYGIDPRLGHHGDFEMIRMAKDRRVVGGGYSPEHVNASDQRHDTSSLLHFMRTLIARYRASAEMGWGQFELVEQSEKCVLVHSLSGAEGSMVALHNFSDAAVTAEFAVPGGTRDHHLVDLLVDGRTVDLGPDGRVSIPMDGYGYRWLRLIGPTGKRLG